MFSNTTVGLIFAAGAAAWVYSKMMKSTGNNTSSAVIVAGVAGLFAFLAVWTIMGLIPQS